MAFDRKVGDLAGFTGDRAGPNGAEIAPRVRQSRMPARPWRGRWTEEQGATNASTSPSSKEFSAETEMEGELDFEGGWLIHRGI